jgi:alanine racemase
VVACGYADGYPRICPTGTPVLVAGVRSRTVGRVSMDMITVDLTPVPDAMLGAEVTLWGRAANGTVLPIDEVARCAGTVGYELMCALAQRVPVVVA